MTPGNEFVPIGQHVETSRQLELDFIDQQTLIYEMKQTARELDENQFAEPTFTSVKLGRIALLNGDGERQGNDKLWLQYSESSNGLGNAVIDFVEDGRLSRMSLSHATHKWDLFQNDHPVPVKEFTSEGVVSILHGKLRKPEVLDSLLDVGNFEPMDIPRLLASHLARSASRRQKVVSYASKDVIAASHTGNANTDSSYLASINTDFTIFNNNGRYIHSLRTSAPYNIGKTTVTKEYSYAAETSDSHFYKSKGTVKVSSKDGYNQNQLDPYSRLDQYVNDPLFSLHKGLSSLRAAHGLDAESAA